MSQRERINNPIKPNQRVSQKEKYANNKRHIKDTADYYIGKTRFNDGAGGDRNYKNLYALYNGDIVDEQWEKDTFDHVLGFYKSDNSPEDFDLPAKIRMNNYIASNVNLLLGEFNKRPEPFILKHEGDSGYTAYNEALQQQINTNLREQFLSVLAEQGIPVDQMPPEEIPMPEQVKQQFDATFIDTFAAKASKKIKDFKLQQEFKAKKHKGFKDWIIAGSNFSYRGIRDNRLVYEDLGPMELAWAKSEHHDFIEDGEFAVRKQKWLVSDVVDFFHSKLTKDDYEELQLNYVSQDMGAFRSLFDPKENQSTEVIDVFQWSYRTEKKIGIWTYINDMGMIESMEVPDSFKVPKEMEDASMGIAWEWVSQVFEGWRLSDHIHLEVEENEPCSDLGKLPFNGSFFSDRFAKNKSILEQGIPYAIILAILNFKFEETIAKSKGKIIPTDFNALPRKNGWTEQKAFYYADVFGYLLLDRTDTLADKSFNQYSALDMGLWDHAKNIREMIMLVKNDWDESLGITRQRKGNVMATDTVGGTERANFQSAIISDHIFSTFDRTTLRDLNHFLELLKYLDIQGEKDLIFDEISQIMTMVEFLPEDFSMEKDLRFHYVDSTKERDNLEMLKNHAVASLANKGDLATVAEILNQDSMAELKRRLQVLKRQESEIAQQQMEAETKAQADAEQKIKEMEAFTKELEHNFDIALQDHKYNREERLAAVKQSLEPATELSSDTGIDPVDANLRATDIASRAEQAKEKNRIDAFKVASDLAKSKLDNAIKLRDIESKERIAKDNNRTALKNKVSGED